MKIPMKKILSAVMVIALAFAFMPAQSMAAATLSQGSVSSDLGACQQFSSNGLQSVVGCLIGIMKVLINLMMAASVVVIVWGAFKMIYSEEGREDAKKTIYYGIIGLFVMISIWGLVNILVNTFNLRGTVHQPPALLP